jgi:hypothetical protein
VACLMTVPSDMAIGHGRLLALMWVRLPARSVSPVPTLGTDSGDAGPAVHSSASCLAPRAGIYEAKAA